MNAWPFILTFVAGLAHAETNVDPKTDLVEAWGTSDKCPGYLRLRAEKEDKSAYWIDNLPLSHPKLDGLEANVSVSNVEILAQGCDTKPEPTFNPETDVYTEAVFPDNVTLPLKPMGSIPKLDKIDEDDLSPKLLAFLNDVRAALRKDKVLNDEKPIIVYGTASAARPSCQVEPGYEKFIEKSFDQKDRLSNVELAYKRALSTAVILKKFIVDYAAADDKKNTKSKSVVG